MRKIIIEDVDLMDKEEEKELKRSLRKMQIGYKEVSHDGSIRDRR